MATIWVTFTYVLLPPAIILLLLLLIPFPRVLDKGVYNFTNFIFNLRIGTISICQAITVISFIVLVAQTFDLRKRYERDEAAPLDNMMGYSADLQKKATRWRSERNWWISAMTFTIYWMMFRFHGLKKKLLEAQRRDD